MWNRLLRSVCSATYGFGVALIAASADAHAATINVPGDYATIQGAISKAAPYDTIQVAAGTYNETINVDRPITLLGAQANVNPSASGRAGGESSIASTYAVTINASDVVINGFEIKDFRYGVNVAGPFPAPDYKRSNISILYNWVHSSIEDVWVGFNAEPGLLENLQISFNIFDVFDTRTAYAPLATVTTGASRIEALASQKIHPFTDLLLHDMGAGLADGRPEYLADGTEWRTTPLWGIGLADVVLGRRATYLHDGRARTLKEAILWHGGEASQSREAFRNASASARDELIAFLRSL